MVYDDSVSRSLNRVTLLGRIGKDADSKFIGNGTHVCAFSLATERAWKDQAGEWKKETDWHNVVLWRSEKLAQYLTKGASVYVEGRLSTRSYDKDGQKRYVTEIVSDNVILCGGPQGEERPTPTRHEPAARPAR